MTVYLRNTTRSYQFDAPALARTAKRLLRALGEGGSSLSLSFVGDTAIRRLNREHRGKDRATDVLSFPLHESALSTGAPKRVRVPRADSGEPGPERMLGDIVISVERARRQAREYDAPLDDELKRLLIHGLLHLLGHDHVRRAERARMEDEERQLAAAIGLRWPYDLVPSSPRAAARGGGPA